jgi:proteasome lid subunit RPN8/RPN11
LADLPNECCGIVATRDGEALAVHRARNEAASPFKYVLHPEDLFRIYNALEQAGHELGIIYHSHVRSAPIPSQTDINLAKFGDGPRFPGTLYMIVGIEDREHPDIRLWSIDGDSYAPVDFQVTD